MGGWEGRVDTDAGLEEPAAGAVEGGPLAHGDALDGVVHGEAVCDGFAAEDAGFSGLIALAQFSRGEESDGGGGEEAGEAVGGGGGVRVEGWVKEVTGHDLVIGGGDAGGREDEQNGAEGVGRVQVGGACPDSDLVLEDVARGIADGGGVAVSVLRLRGIGQVGLLPESSGRQDEGGGEKDREGAMEGAGSGFHRHLKC